jgi:DNA-binding CsgD family transcriptional regulator
MLVQATSTGRHHLDAGEHRYWRGNGHAVAEDAWFEPDALWELTPQQGQIVRLPSKDLTNREIGDRLFLSPRTVSSHLYRSYPKLGVASCLKLRRGRSRDHVNTSSRRPRKRDAPLRRFPQGNKHASPRRRAGYLDYCGAELAAPRLPAAG